MILWQDLSLAILTGKFPATYRNFKIVSQEVFRIVPTVLSKQSDANHTLAQASAWEYYKLIRVTCTIYFQPRAPKHCTTQHPSANLLCPYSCAAMQLDLTVFPLPLGCSSPTARWMVEMLSKIR